ncbi:MAG: hypothetical protein R3B49_01825 [Phycisphaerales bacterium]
MRVINPPAAVEVLRQAAHGRGSERAGVPTPGVRVAVDADSATMTVEQIRYPRSRPTVGSWGRLVARVNDRDAAEAIIEHRAPPSGSVSHSVFYVQETHRQAGA